MFIFIFHRASAFSDYRMVIKKGAEDELVVQGTVAELWMLDLVGIYAQKKSLKVEG